MALPASWGGLSSPVLNNSQLRKNIKVKCDEHGRVFSVARSILASNQDLKYLSCVNNKSLNCHEIS